MFLYITLLLCCTYTSSIASNTQPTPLPKKVTIKKPRTWVKKSSKKQIMVNILRGLYFILAVGCLMLFLASPLPCTHWQFLRKHLKAQHNGDAATYTEAMNELKAGKKKTHWIWYIFPLPYDRAGLSPRSRAYAFRDKGQLKAYLKHPRLSKNYLHALKCLKIGHTKAGSLNNLVGIRDASKIRDSLHYFANQSINPAVAREAAKMLKQLK